jgi:hypothetical protein
MVQDFVEAAYRWVLGGAGILKHFLPLTVFALFAAAIVWLAYRRIDPEGQVNFGKRLRGLGSRAGLAFVVALVTIVFCGMLVESRKMVETRRATIESASASRRREPNLSGIVQFAPVVALIQEKTYTRTLTLPPDFATRVGAEGIQVLAPYLQDPSAENVLKLVDSFKRSGQDVLFTRELTRRDEMPVAAEAADIKVAFQDEGAPSGRRHYSAEFIGEYRFKNPGAAEAPMRFGFNLPEGGGTVQEFYIQVGEQKIMEPDDHGIYEWEGQVPAGAQMTARVHYRVTGAALYEYRLGSERRRIGDFKLVTTSPQEPQFSKSGIYPTTMNGSQAEWRLKDVLTSQAISLVFPRADIHSQLLDKSMAILPMAMALFAFAAIWLVPKNALWGSIAIGIAFLSIPVLSAYASPLVTTLVGSMLAVLAGGLTLRGTLGWVIALLSGVLPTVFLTVEHGSLVGWILAAIAGVLIVMKAPKAIESD